MPYRKIGFVRIPRALYIAQHSRDIINAFTGKELDREIAETIKSLGSDRDLIRDFVFQRVLRTSHPVLDSNPTLKEKFQLVLLDYLGQCGFIKEQPVGIDYITDPVMKLDLALDLMIGSKLPKFSASEINGDNAKISTLMDYFPEVLRRNALILNERAFLADRVRIWLGSVGYTVRHGNGKSLSQFERSALTIWGCQEEGAKGYIVGAEERPIKPLENKDPLVLEAGALLSSVCIPGPFLNHMKLISNATAEQLVFYFGPHVAEIKSDVGYIEDLGPWEIYHTSPEDNIPWELESQITGVSAKALDIVVRPKKTPPFTFRVPDGTIYYNAEDRSSLYHDLPEYDLYLTDEDDISRYTWDYPSRLYQRRISSQFDGGDLTHALADFASATRTAGGMQIEAMEIPSDVLLWLTPEARKKVKNYNGNIMESYIFPSPGGLATVELNMASFYSRYGTHAKVSAFSEFIQMPASWFFQPNDRVLDTVQRKANLSTTERVRFSAIIALCHNVARYERLTGQQAPVDTMQYAKLILQGRIQR